MFDIDDWLVNYLKCYFRIAQNYGIGSSFDFVSYEIKAHLIGLHF